MKLKGDLALVSIAAASPSLHRNIGESDHVLSH